MALKNRRRPPHLDLTGTELRNGMDAAGAMNLLSASILWSAASLSGGPHTCRGLLSATLPAISMPEMMAQSFKTPIRGTFDEDIPLEWVSCQEDSVMDHACTIKTPTPQLASIQDPYPGTVGPAYTSGFTSDAYDPPSDFSASDYGFDTASNMQNMQQMDTTPHSGQQPFDTEVQMPLEYVSSPPVTSGEQMPLDHLDEGQYLGYYGSEWDGSFTGHAPFNDPLPVNYQIPMPDQVIPDQVIPGQFQFGHLPQVPYIPFPAAGFVPRNAQFSRPGAPPPLSNLPMMVPDRMYSFPPDPNASDAPNDRKRPYGLESPIPPRYLFPSPMSPTFFRNNTEKRHKQDPRAFMPAIMPPNVPVTRRTSRRFQFREVDPSVRSVVVRKGPQQAVSNPFNAPASTEPVSALSNSTEFASIATASTTAASTTASSIAADQPHGSYVSRHVNSTRFSLQDTDTGSTLDSHEDVAAREQVDSDEIWSQGNMRLHTHGDPSTAKQESTEVVEALQEPHLPAIADLGSTDGFVPSMSFENGEYQFDDGNPDLDSLFGSPDDASCPGTDRAMAPLYNQQPTSALASDVGYDGSPPSSLEIPESSVYQARMLGSATQTPPEQNDDDVVSNTHMSSPEADEEKEAPLSILRCLVSNPKSWKNALKDTRGLLRCPSKRCRESFKNVAAAASHYDRYPGHRVFKYKCAFRSCPWAYVGFQQNNEAIRHMKASHCATKKFSCAGCCKKFCRMDGLRRHEKTCPMFQDVVYDVEETLQAIPELVKKRAQSTRSTSEARAYQSLVSKRRAELMDQVKEATLDARLPAPAFRRKQRKLAATQTERNHEEQNKLLIDLFGSLILRPEIDAREERRAQRNPRSMISEEEDMYIQQSLAQVEEIIQRARNAAVYVPSIEEDIDYSEPPPMPGFEVRIDNAQASWLPPAPVKPTVKPTELPSSPIPPPPSKPARQQPQGEDVKVFSATPTVAPVMPRKAEPAAPAAPARRKRGRPCKRKKRQKRA